MKATAHARDRWIERGGVGAWEVAFQQATRLPRRPDRPHAQGYAWADLVFVVRGHRLRTVMTRQQWDQVHLDTTWDGIPVRRPLPARAAAEVV